MERRDVMLIITIFAFTIFIFTFKGDEELRTLLIFAFYFAVSLIYGLDSRYPIVAAIFLLISAAIFLTTDEDLANKLAIYAYYFLVVGVLLQLIEYVKEQRREVEEVVEPGEAIATGRYIAIASGKGGVGKTTLATNLAAAFAKLGRKCLVADFDMSMPCIDIAMGIKPERSLKDALNNSIKIEECIYNVNGCAVLPNSPIPAFFRSGDNTKKLKNLVDQIRNNYEIILLDFPPGSNLELLDEFSGEISLIIIANPDKPSLVNSYNIKTLAHERGCEVIGMVLNRVREDVDVSNLEETLEIPVIAILPEDDEVKESFNEGVPLVVKDESREFSKEITDLARFLLGFLSRLQ